MKVTILYGSATGNAEHIAKDLASTINDKKNQRAATFFQSADVMECNHFKRKKLLELWAQPPHSVKRHALIVVCSTSGNGDAPENASRFVRHIKKPPPTLSTMPLEYVAYAVLGLGDTNYDKFCEAGKVIDKKLHEWGARRSMALTCADEATGLEETVEPWLDQVLIQLERACTAECEDEPIIKNDNLAINELNDVVKEKLVLLSGCDETTQLHAQSMSTDTSSTTTSTIEQSSVTLSNNLTLTERPMKSPTPLFILYGSATGNSEHIAKDLCSTFETNLKNPSFLGYFPSVVCCELNQFKKKCLDTWLIPPDPTNVRIKHGIIIISSTTGNANAPENADRFVRWLKREQSKAFQHCAYAVLGLGDSNYDVFCAIGKIIDKRLNELGGSRATRVALADEATGLEEVVDPWVEKVIGSLTNACRSSLPAKDDVPSSSVPSLRATTTEKTKEQTTTKDTTLRVHKDSSHPHTEEEKKTDKLDECIISQSCENLKVIDDVPNNIGVDTIRTLLSLLPHVPLPTTPNSSPPPILTSLSSCELIHDEGILHRPRGGSVADNMTISSASSGYLYTFNSPYESRILSARYLTATDGKCAEKVTNNIFIPTTERCEDERILEAMKMYDEYFPLFASPIGLTSEGHEEQLRFERNGKRVIEMTLSLPDDFTLEYEPGDSVGIIVHNNPQSIQFILNMLERNHGILPSQKISVDSAQPITVEMAVRSKIDLCSPIKRKQLYLLSMHATDPEEERALRLLSSGNGKGDDASNLFHTYITEQHRTVVDILREFPSSQTITLEGLIGCLPSIPPRYYSVCSSPLLDRQKGTNNDTFNFHLKVAFSVVDYLTPPLPKIADSRRRIGGLATRRLECLCSPHLGETPVVLSADRKSSTSKLPTVHIFPKPTHEFRLPPNMSTPLILIGPGTGIAPFIGFLSHRQAQMALLNSTEAAEIVSEGTWRGGYDLDREDLALSKGDTRGLSLAADFLSKHQQLGEIDLFFGCRHCDHDYLYKKELEEFKSRGILTNLFVAFSRDGGGKKEKTYVQTLMRDDIQCRKRLVSMIMEKAASVYVCGDGTAMGKDVQETIIFLVAETMKANGDYTDSSKEPINEAIAYVDEMKKCGRFVLDIWSS